MINAESALKQENCHFDQHSKDCFKQEPSMEIKSREAWWGMGSLHDLKASSHRWPTSHREKISTDWRSWQHSPSWSTSLPLMRSKGAPRASGSGAWEDTSPPWDLDTQAAWTESWGDVTQIQLQEYFIKEPGLHVSKMSMSWKIKNGWGTASDLKNEEAWQPHGAACDSLPCYEGHVGPHNKTRIGTTDWVKHLISVKFPELGSYDHVQEHPCFQEIQF